MAHTVLTEQEAADYLKLTLEEFRELQAGPHPIPTFTLLPGVIRIRLADLERWIESGRRLR